MAWALAAQTAVARSTRPARDSAAEAAVEVKTVEAVAILAAEAAAVVMVVEEESVVQRAEGETAAAMTEGVRAVEV